MRRAIVDGRGFRAIRRDLALALACALGMLVVGTGLVPDRAVAAGGSDDSLTLSHTLTRTWFPGGTETTEHRDVTVRVDRHTNLQTRERINVSWSGAHPSGGRAANPYGAGGMGQEYPVLILECRGRDDASLPEDQQLKPSTCWTASVGERTQSASRDQAVWLKDREAAAGDLGDVSGIDRTEVPSSCGIQPGTAYHITPFQGAATATGGGTFYASCSTDTMAPETTVAGADPPNEIAAFTGTDGTGSVNVEVRTDIENESLGCSDRVPCSLVVLPIMGISCVDASAPCNDRDVYAPGEPANDTQGMGAAAVTAYYWWSASNWNQKFVIPLDFAPPPNTCDLLGSGAPVPFYGSELLSQAALQWAPAYCLNRSRFNWQFNTMPDDAALAQMNNGSTIAAEVTSRGSDTNQSVAYAPSAVSGWAIAFDIDRPDKSEQTTLRLNARLLAKLLTESYPGTTMVRRNHGGLDSNPLSLNLDPEFKALNPGLDSTRFTEAAATLMSISGGSDVMRQLTSYIATDPDAAAFVKGQADPWGMKVNPFYRGLSLPVSTWPLLDTWVPAQGTNDCLDRNPAPYMPRVAAPVSDMRLIATALVLNWPYVNTKCTLTGPNQYKIGRVDPQGLGDRFILGLVTLADARRYGLRVASLQTRQGSFVAPTSSSLGAAVGLMRQSGALQPFTLPMREALTSGTAYPGTMVVHTAAKAHGGLSASDAKTVAQFISVSTSEGQVPGRDNGELPDGYLPLTDPSAKKLLVAAQQARAAILATAPATPSTSPPPSSGPSATASPTTVPVSGPVAPTPPTVPGAAVPAVAPSAAAVPALSAETYRTRAVSSALGGGLLPLLLFCGLGAGLVTALTRVTLRLKGLR